MLDICLLGTGGTMPLPERALTSLYVKYNGKGILIDCGEGTQIMMKKKHLSLNSIDVILFTHFHADHIAGLPGLLLSVAKSERTQPVTLVGPLGLERVVRSLCIIAPQLPFELRFTELDGKPAVLPLLGLKVEAFPALHSVMCCGYSIVLERAGRFDPQRAEALGIPKQFWKTLQHGGTAELDGKVFRPEDVLGAPRKGLKVTYCTDTRPTQTVCRAAQNADLFICEGMYADPEKLDKAVQNFHCMFSEAAQMAKDAGASVLWLTHFSPSLPSPEDYIGAATEIFPNTIVPSDMQSVTLNFDK